MKSKCLMFIGTLLLLVSCAPRATLQPNDTSDTSLLFVEGGSVRIKRSEWNGFFQVSSGAILYPGDQLSPSAGAQVDILCSDFSLWALPAGAVSGVNNGCKSNDRTFLIRSNGNIGGTRGSINPLIPYIISPRATKILGSRPLLRWNPVPGAQSYNVSLMGGNSTWQTTTTSNQLIYPGNPDLIPGKTYWLSVQTNSGTSSEEGIPNLGFTVLPADTSEQISHDVQLIDSIDLRYPDKQYAIAQLYASHDLIAEAIQMLEGLSVSTSPGQHVLITEGDLYLEIGLPALAERSYMEGLNAIVDSNDVESTAMAEKGLGEAYLSIGNMGLARAWFKRAESAYQEIGDTIQIQQLQVVENEANP